MPIQITYRKGEFRTFIAARTFALGNTGQSIAKGQDLRFDGSTVDIGGDTFVMPQLKGAVAQGWLVLEEQFDAEDTSSEIPRTANIQVRHATQGGNPMRPHDVPRTTMTAAETDEREVGDVQAHASSTNERNAGYRRGDPVNAAELQDGVPVRTLKTAAGEKAKQTRTVLTAGSVGQALRDAESVTIDPGRGMSEAEMLERMSEEDQERYLAKKEARRAQYVDDAPARVVGKVKKSSESATREGVTATVTSGRGVEIADLSGMDSGKSQVQEFEQDGIKFTTTNGPKRQDQPHPRSAEAQQPVMLRDGTAEVRRQVAQQLCPDFPANYDFAASPKKKLARLQADYEDRPDVLKAVFAAETDAFKALLIQEFADQLRA
ncbi:MAG: hypothetical protein WC565_08790 [Parcubacteria group bacterium]